MFLGRLGQECSDGYIWDAGIQSCVQTYSTDVTDCADPNKVWNELTQTCEPSGGGSIISMNTVLLMGAMGFVLLLLTSGSGRKKSATPKITSRTTTRTRTLFA